MKDFLLNGAIILTMLAIMGCIVGAWLAIVLLFVFPHHFSELYVFAEFVVDGVIFTFFLAFLGGIKFNL